MRIIQPLWIGVLVILLGIFSAIATAEEELEEIASEESADLNPEVEEMLEVLNLRGRITLYVVFDANRSIIKNESLPIIEQLTAMMKADTSLELTIEAYSNDAGDAKSNQLLAEGRAKMIMGGIASGRIDMKRLSAIGKGEDKLIADNLIEERQAGNCRIELVKRKINPYANPGPKVSDHFGIPVYPEATLDIEQTEYAKYYLGDGIYVYRTDDSMTKVNAFYKNVSGLLSLGGDDKSVLYLKDDSNISVRLVISNPWIDPRTGEERFDTMIQILKSE